MVRARGDAGIDGFINLCKPAGPTSHDLVAIVRRRLATRRVGHAGTLDPLAEGVLPLALGRATRLVEALADADKEYYAEIELGRRTTTDDAEGELVLRSDVPDFSPAELDAALASLQGQIEQVPPSYSALKVGGRRSYALARTGQSPVLAARRVQIYSIVRRAWARPVGPLRDAKAQAAVRWDCFASTAAVARRCPAGHRWASAPGRLSTATAARMPSRMQSVATPLGASGFSTSVEVIPVPDGTTLPDEAHCTPACIFAPHWPPPSGCFPLRPLLFWQRGTAIRQHNKK